MNLKNLIWFSLVLILLANGCQLFPPLNVETIVKENNLNYWHLSPNGDYLVYGSPRGKGNFLLDIATGQEHEFNCKLHWWDNYLIGCYNSPELSVIDAKTLTETQLTLIDLTKQLEINDLEYINEAFIKQLLVNAEKIYHPEWVTHTVYILAPDYRMNPNENYIIWGLKQPDRLLAQYPITVIPRNQPSNYFSEKMFSPNNLYYYNTTTDGFAIFNTSNDKVVSEFVDEDIGNLDILGWSPDSNGVYFITYRLGFSLTDLPKTIRKLKIPDE